MISGIIMVEDSILRLQQLNGGFVVRLTKGRESKAVYQLPGEMLKAQQWIEAHVDTEGGRAIGTAALTCFDDVRRISDRGAR
jgi:hypothetical protein